MKQIFSIFFNILSVVALLNIPLLVCGESLPKGDYAILEPDKINRFNHSELKKQLIASNSEFRLSFQFWMIQKIKEKTYLVVFGQNKSERIYFHLLVKTMDENITKLATTGGYRHAVLKDLEWSYEEIDSVEEMVYKNMLKILD
jgi:hypothetical protein